MEKRQFKKIMSDFTERSLVSKTTTTALVVSANKETYTVAVFGRHSQLKNSLASLMVDYPELISTIDGACRHARAIIKERQKEQDNGTESR